jgi:uncharacterized membrane protein
LALIFKHVLPQSRSTKLLWTASLLISAALLLLPLLFKLDGKEHAHWQQFLGRFHPLVVHLPIGFLLLVPLLELVGTSRRAMREAAGLVLWLAAFGCLGAVSLGYLLAYGSGDAAVGVIRHMWGGIALTIGVLLCCLVRPSWVSGEHRRIYPCLLGCVMLLLTWTAHQGGTLTHGSEYLTQYLPGFLKRWPGLRTVEAKSSIVRDSFYAKHIYPALDANCVECHGPSKVKGGLRLDSYALLLEGGLSGPVIVPGQPAKSLLLERITLPPDHKKFMPANGKSPLKAEEISWIKAWIQQGASPSATSLVGIVTPAEEIPLPQVGDYSRLMAEIGEIEKSEGIMLLPVSRKPGDGLILDTVNVAGTFNDAQLAKLEKFAPYIVEAELGRTAITDAGFDTIGKFSHLRALHLEDTEVKGSGLGKLTGLSDLTYVNLSGTNVTTAAVAPLARMKNLHHLYLYNTPAQPAIALPIKQP